MDRKEFDRYNPNFDKVIASAENNYELKLPAAKMELFNTYKFQILEESIQALLNGFQTGRAADNNTKKIAVK
jgi:membrane-bound lytic murein transglycosylase D